MIKIGPYIYFLRHRACSKRTPRKDAWYLAVWWQLAPYCHHTSLSGIYNIFPEPTNLLLIGIMLWYYLNKGIIWYSRVLVRIACTWPINCSLPLVIFHPTLSWHSPPDAKHTWLTQSDCDRMDWKDDTAGNWSEQLLNKHALHSRVSFCLVYGATQTCWIK